MNLKFINISLFSEYIYAFSFFFGHLFLNSEAILPIISFAIVSFLNPGDEKHHNFIGFSGILF
jgi:hypothetical protein